MSLTDASLGAACEAKAVTNDSGSTRSSSEVDAGAADAAARWKRSLAASWLGDWDPGTSAAPSDEDPLAPEGAEPCDAIESAPLPEGLLDGDPDPREASPSAAPSPGETAAFCQRHWELVQKGEPGAAWNPFAEPWEPSRQQRQAGRLRGPQPPGPNGADAAAGTAAVAWGATRPEALEQEGRAGAAAARFCAWCGGQVPPNLVQARFCIFCGKAHGGATSAAVPSGPAKAPAEGAPGAAAGTPWPGAGGAAPVGARGRAPPRPGLSGVAGPGAPPTAAPPWRGSRGSAAEADAEAEILGELTDAAWNAMTPGERILALVKTGTTPKVDVPTELQ